MNYAQIPTFIPDQQGRIIVNPKKQFVQPFELGIDAPNAIVTVAPGAQAGPFPMSARFDGPIECFYIKVLVIDDATGLAVTDYDIDWFLEHPGKRKQFMNRRIPLIATAGDAGRPYVMPESIWIPSVQSLNVTFFSRETVRTLRIELVLGSIKFYPNSAPKAISQDMWGYIARRERTYTYWQTTDAAVALIASQTGFTATMTIPDDADLEVFKLTAETDEDFRTRIVDGQSDRAVNSANQASSLLFGGHIATAMGGGIGGSGGCFPARWATTFLVRRSTQLQLVFDNISGANPTTIRVVFGGRKVSYA